MTLARPSIRTGATDQVAQAHSRLPRQQRFTRPASHLIPSGQAWPYITESFLGNNTEGDLTVGQGTVDQTSFQIS